MKKRGPWSWTAHWDGPVAQWEIEFPVGAKLVHTQVIITDDPPNSSGLITTATKPEPHLAIVLIFDCPDRQQPMTKRAMVALGPQETLVPEMADFFECVGGFVLPNKTAWTIYLMDPDAASSTVH